MIMHFYKLTLFQEQQLFIQLMKQLNSNHPLQQYKHSNIQTQNKNKFVQQNQPPPTNTSQIVNQQQINNYITKQALLANNSMDIVVAVCMLKLTGTIPQRLQQIIQSIVQYFYHECNINLTYQYFTAKFQADYSNLHTQPLTNSVIVYGVDFLNTKQIAHRFSPSNEHNIKKINWINDSNVQLIFMLPQSAIDALEWTSKKTQGYKKRCEAQGGNHFPKGWFELDYYEIYKVKRRLFARFATSLQRQIKTTRSPNRFMVFERAQQNLQDYLLQTYQTYDNYQQMQRVIQYEQYKAEALKRGITVPQYYEQQESYFQGYNQQEYNGQQDYNGQAYNDGYDDFECSMIGRNQSINGQQPRDIFEDVNASIIHSLSRNNSRSSMFSAQQVSLVNQSCLSQFSFQSGNSSCRGEIVDYSMQMDNSSYIQAESLNQTNKLSFMKQGEKSTHNIIDDSLMGITKQQ